MYIYLQGCEQFNEFIDKNKNLATYLRSIDFNEIDPMPHISVNVSFLILNASEQMKSLKPFFIHATDHCYPDFGNYRELGIYKFGDATGELGKKNDNYWLRLKTNKWEGIMDMEVLKGLINDGKILPKPSYENEQIKKGSPKSILNFLKSLFKFRK